MVKGSPNVQTWGLSNPSAKPTAPATCGDSGGGTYTPPGLKTPRAAVCNRMIGHEGPHRVYDGLTFRVLVEWPRRQAPRGIGGDAREY